MAARSCCGEFAALACFRAAFEPCNSNQNSQHMVWELDGAEAQFWHSSCCAARVVRKERLLAGWLRYKDLNVAGGESPWQGRRSRPSLRC